MEWVHVCVCAWLLFECSPDVKSWLIWRDPDAGKDWGQEEKGMTEDEMVGWHHQLNGHECGWTPGVGDGQGGLACCSSCGRKESDMTDWLNWTELLLSVMSSNIINVFYFRLLIIKIFSNYCIIHPCCSIKSDFLYHLDKQVNCILLDERWGCMSFCDYDIWAKIIHINSRWKYLIIKDQLTL